MFIFPLFSFLVDVYVIPLLGFFPDLFYFIQDVSGTAFPSLVVFGFFVGPVLAWSLFFSLTFPL